MSRVSIPPELLGPSIFDDDPPDWWPGEGSLGNLLADLTPAQRAEYDAYQQLQSNYRRRTFSMFLAAIFGPSLGTPKRKATQCKSKKTTTTN